MRERLEPVTPAPPHVIVRPWMRQSWIELTFLHWRYPVDAVRPLVPHGLDIDVCDGSAWVGLVPFVIIGLTYPGAPALPWVSHFPETNVRTYVSDRKGRSGVWFLSLDAARLAAVVGARLGYALPYFWSEMQVIRDGDSVRYRSRRKAGPEAHSRIDICAGEPVSRPSDLEHFLTARFRLFAVRGSRLSRADIAHQPWPLHRARVLRLEETLVRACGLPAPEGPPLAHFAPRVDVLVGGPRGFV